MECEMDRWFGAASAVMQAVYQTIVMKREPRHKAILLMYQTILVPTLTYGNENKVMDTAGPR